MRELCPAKSQVPVLCPLPEHATSGHSARRSCGCQARVGRGTALLLPSKHLQSLGEAPVLAPQATREATCATAGQATSLRGHGSSPDPAPGREARPQAVSDTAPGVWPGSPQPPHCLLRPPGLRSPRQEGTSLTGPGCGRALRPRALSATPALPKWRLLGQPSCPPGGPVSGGCGAHISLCGQ